MPLPCRQKNKKGARIVALIALAIVMLTSAVVPYRTESYSTDYVTLVAWTEGGDLYSYGPSQFWNVTAIKNNYLYSSNGLVQNLSGKNLHLFDVRDIIVANPGWSASDLSNNLTSLLANLPGQSVLIVLAHGTPDAFHPYKYDGAFTSGEYVPIPSTWANSWHNTLVWASQVNQTTANKNVYELPSVVILGFCNSLGNTRSFDNLTNPSRDSWIYAYKFLITRSPYYVYGRAIVGFLTHIDIYYPSSGSGLATSAGLEFLNRFSYLYLVKGYTLQEAFESAPNFALYDGYATYLYSLYYGIYGNVTYTNDNPIPRFDDDAAAVIGYYASYADPTMKDMIIPKVLDQLKDISPTLYDIIIKSGVSPKVDFMGSTFDLVSPSGRILHAYDVGWLAREGSPIDLSVAVFASDDGEEVYVTRVGGTVLNTKVVPDPNTLQNEFRIAVERFASLAGKFGLSYIRKADAKNEVRYAITYNGYPVIIPQPKGFAYARPLEVGYQLVIDSAGHLRSFSFINTASMLSGITSLKAENIRIGKDEVMKSLNLSINADIKGEWIVLNNTLLPIYVIDDGDKLFIVDASTGKVIHDATMSSLEGLVGEGEAEETSTSPSDDGGQFLTGMAPYLIAAVVAALLLTLVWRVTSRR